jgi:hypothetical protein
VPGSGGHAYNPSYSGGRDQEDCALKPGWANGSGDPISKKKKKKKTEERILSFYHKEMNDKCLRRYCLT